MRHVNRDGSYWAIAVCAVGLAGTAVCWAEGRSVILDNGVVGDGHLAIELDEFGSFGDWTPSWRDDFDPCPDVDGADPPEASATFHTALYIYIDPSDGMGGGTHRGVLSSHSSIVDVFQNDATRPGNLFPYIISKNTGSNGDATTSSEVGISDVEGGGGEIDLHVAVTNTIGVGATGPPPDNACSATLTQRYVFTNIGSGKLTFLVNKHIDEVLLWYFTPFGHPGEWLGVDFARRCYPAVFAQDGPSPKLSLVSTFTRDPLLDPQVSAFYYYGAGFGIQPPDGILDFDSGGDCPQYGFGTDYQIWDNHGIPRCWRNRVAVVGTNTQGIAPKVSKLTHIGTQLEITLEVGESYDVEYETIYGYRPTVPENDCNQNGTQDECEFENDCNRDDIPDDCQLEGNDCNENGTLDGCESGNDCNVNGIPDDCEPDTDCNTNGAADICDLADGTSPDCNGNASPDECDVASGQSPDHNENGVPDECDPTCSTNTDCADDSLCTFDVCGQSVCTHAPARYGDIAGLGGTCGPNDNVDLSDILAVLDAFQSVVASGCALSNIDIAGQSDPCIADGTIDLLDILAVLDAFQGDGGCCVSRR